MNASFPPGRRRGGRRRPSPAPRMSRGSTSASRRVSANPMEPRNALAELRPDRGALHAHHRHPAAACDAERDRARFALSPFQPAARISPDVGGGFGMKESPFQEHVLACWRRGGSAGRCAGRRRGPRVSSPTPMRATMSRPPSWRWLRMANSSACGCGRWATSAPISRWQAPVSSTNNVGGLAGVYRTPHICTEVTRHLHPYPAHRALSRRRAAGGDLCDGADDRPRRGRDGPGPHRAAPAQHDPAGGDALPDRPRLHLRQRRLPRGTWRWRWRPPIGTASRRGARLRGARPAARHRHRQCHRERRRAAPQARWRKRPRSASIPAAA